MARSRRLVGEDAIRASIAGAEEYSGDGAGGSRNEKLVRKTCNDDGNAERFRARHGRNCIYVDEIGWLAWTKTH